MDPRTPDPKASDDGREGPGTQPADLEGDERRPDGPGPADVAAAEDEATPAP